MSLGGNIVEGKKTKKEGVDTKRSGPHLAGRFFKFFPSDTSYERTCGVDSGRHHTACSLFLSFSPAGHEILICWELNYKKNYNLLSAGRKIVAIISVDVSKVH